MNYPCSYLSVDSGWRELHRDFFINAWAWGRPGKPTRWSWHSALERDQLVAAYNGYKP